VYSTYVPAGHNKQVAADADVAPVRPYFPTEQGVPEQVDEESDDEYVPVGQSAQWEEPTVAWNLPGGHDQQVESAVAPTAAEYVPATQLMQTEEPVVRAQRKKTSHLHIHIHIFGAGGGCSGSQAAANFPATHSAQVEEIARDRHQGHLEIQRYTNVGVQAEVTHIYRISRTLKTNPYYHDHCYYYM
jgi:hypothetical protein